MTGEDVVPEKVAKVHVPASDPSLRSRSILQVLHLLLQRCLPPGTEFQSFLQCGVGDVLGLQGRRDLYVGRVEERTDWQSQVWGRVDVGDRVVEGHQDVALDTGQAGQDTQTREHDTDDIYPGSFSLAEADRLSCEKLELKRNLAGRDGLVRLVPYHRADIISWCH